MFQNKMCDVLLNHALYQARSQNFQGGGVLFGGKWTFLLGGDRVLCTRGGSSMALH